MRFLSLFAGIGGFDLGLERAGWTCAGQVEIDPYCRAVLAKHWPNVKRMEDVREVRGDEFGPVDAVVGGFPCQDVSNAGLRAGISGKRSGLYGELVRCLCVVRPIYAVLENVAALLGRGMGRVLGDVAEIGYDAEWDCVPACAVGARHIRNRVFIVATPGKVANPNSVYQRCTPRSTPTIERWRRFSGISDSRHGTPWTIEPDVGRVAYGIPCSMDRKTRLGNSIVPQVAQAIGEAINAVEGDTDE